MVPTALPLRCVVSSAAASKVHRCNHPVLGGVHSNYFALLTRPSAIEPGSFRRIWPGRVAPDKGHTQEARTFPKADICRLSPLPPDHSGGRADGDGAHQTIGEGSPLFMAWNAAR